MKNILKMSRKIANLCGHIFYPKKYPLDMKNVPKISLKKLQIFTTGHIKDILCVLTLAIF